MKRCSSVPFARAGVLQSVSRQPHRGGYEYPAVGMARFPDAPINYAVARKHLERVLRASPELAAAIATG